VAPFLMAHGVSIR